MALGLARWRHRPCLYRGACRYDDSRDRDLQLRRGRAERSRNASERPRCVESRRHSDPGRSGSTVPERAIRRFPCGRRGTRRCGLVGSQGGQLCLGRPEPAGRALAKHGGRPGSAFPAASGSPSAISKQTTDYANGYFRFYNNEGPGQPLDVYGKPGPASATQTMKISLALYAGGRGELGRSRGGSGSLDLASGEPPGDTVPGGFRVDVLARGLG
jgi:hypothetical protein